MRYLICLTVAAIIGLSGCELEKIDFINFEQSLELNHQPLIIGPSQLIQAQNTDYLIAGTSRDTQQLFIRLEETGRVAINSVFGPGTAHGIAEHPFFNNQFAVVGNNGNDCSLTILNGAGSILSTTNFLDTLRGELGLLEIVQGFAVTALGNGFVVGGYISQLPGLEQAILIEVDSLGKYAGKTRFALNSRFNALTTFRDTILGNQIRDNRPYLSIHRPNLVQEQTQSLSSVYFNSPTTLITEEDRVTRVVSREDDPDQLLLIQHDFRLTQRLVTPISASDVEVDRLTAYHVTRAREGGYLVQAIASKNSEPTDQHYFFRINAEGTILWEEIFPLPALATPVGVLQSQDFGFASVVVVETAPDSSQYFFFKTDEAGRTRENP